MHEHLRHNKSMILSLIRLIEDGVLEFDFGAVTQLRERLHKAANLEMARADPQTDAVRKLFDLTGDWLRLRKFDDNSSEIFEAAKNAIRLLNA